MVSGRRTVITFQKFERSTYRLFSAPALVARCDRCRQEVTWLTPNEALMLSRHNLREIFRLIEAGKIHFVEDEAGFLFICPISLEQAQKE
jgi:hypothetical protein